MQAGASPIGLRADAAGAARRFLPGLAVLLAAATPFLLALIAWRPSGDGLAGSGLPGACPLLDMTGIPCITCGASRAFYFLAHGDGRFLDYNWFWPLLALAAIGYGLVLVVRALRREPVFGRRAAALADLYATRPAPMAAATLAFLLVPWLVALSNIDPIRGT